MNDRLDVLNKPIQKIGLFIKRKAEDVEASLHSILKILEAKNLDIKIASNSPHLKVKGYDIMDPELLNNKVDCVLSLGGDGTMLQVAHVLARQGTTPIIGLHLGHLGFLTQINMEEFEDALQKLTEGRYRLKKRMLLDIQVIRNGKVHWSDFCLNEVVVHRKKIARIIDIRVQVEGMPLSRIRGDGVIIATPMGSTAYSLSAGGPIVHPAVKDLVITSLAPHTLTHRPVVVPSDYKITVIPTDDDPDIRLSLTLDGQQECVIRGGDVIEIQKSKKIIQLIDLNRPGRFFETLQDKLHWRI